MADRFDLESDWLQVLRRQMMLRCAMAATLPWIHWPIVGSTSVYVANDRRYHVPMG